jgi:hypothetical protein
MIARKTACCHSFSAHQNIHYNTFFLHALFVLATLTRENRVLRLLYSALALSLAF